MFPDDPEYVGEEVGSTDGCVSAFEDLPVDGGGALYTVRTTSMIRFAPSSSFVLRPDAPTLFSELRRLADLRRQPGGSQARTSEGRGLAG
jgi:hypothetical protein